MPLAPSTRLGPYEILSPIGAGGMGEVYRARDTRLNRTVAIKVLPEHRYSTPQARERFEREAKAISSLNHPHICTLHDVGQQDGIDYLVMEYLEGQTLADRVKKGPLSTDQALRYAIEMTDALDAAHRHNVIHRDLKPGNVMLTKSGAKLLDFGLAKVRATEAVVGTTALPTQTTPLTSEGTILGTLQYMAPEQLEGAEADARTDIFALGAVIYEMATGRKAFEGKSQASLISSIMTSEPISISAMQPVAPPALDHVVRACLAKDPDMRWQTAHDVLVELKWIAEADSERGLRGPVVRRHSRWMALSLALVGLLALGLAGLAIIRVSDQRRETNSLRFIIGPPEKESFDDNASPVISPDGRHLVFRASLRGGGTALWLRSLDSFAPQALPGTEDAVSPFWSADGRFLAFYAEEKLKKIDLSGGGLPQTLCDAPGGGGGGSWNHDGTIIFRPKPGALHRIAATGGEARPILELNRATHETDQGSPYFLPDGRHFLYTSLISSEVALGVYLGSLDTKESPSLVLNALGAFYSAPGFLIFSRGTALLAQPFDLRKFQLTGGPISIAAVQSFSASMNGVLVYRTLNVRRVQLAWYNRKGQRLASIGDLGAYRQITLSPDEKWLTVEREDQPGSSRLWLFELSRGIFSRLTDVFAMDAVWSPDGRQIVYTTQGKSNLDLYRKTIGEGASELLLESRVNKFSEAWVKDGSIIFTDGRTVYRLASAGEVRPEVLFRSAGTGVDEPHVSPDAHWIAYASNETGRWETYVASFPAFTHRRQVSGTGGSQALWRKDGRELFYLSLDGKLMAVDVKPGATLEIGVPRALFQTPVHVDATLDQYCITADGQKFILEEPSEGEQPISVVINWPAGLKR